MRADVADGSKADVQPCPVLRPVYPLKADTAPVILLVRFGPCVDGSGLARRVRPVCAVLMTAGHNALRGSGPGHKRAFDNALARVGCPDRRIDRHCITCCSPPNRHVTPGSPARSHLRRECGGFLVAFVPAIIAHAILASLLASAMAAILVGRRASNAVSQGRCRVPWILA